MQPIARSRPYRSRPIIVNFLLPFLKHCSETFLSDMFEKPTPTLTLLTSYRNPVRFIALPIITLTPCFILNSSCYLPWFIMGTVEFWADMFEKFQWHVWNVSKRFKTFHFEWHVWNVSVTCFKFQWNVSFWVMFWKSLFWNKSLLNFCTTDPTCYKACSDRCVSTSQWFLWGYMELKHTIVAGLFLEVTTLIIIIISLCMPMFPGLIIITKRHRQPSVFYLQILYENWKMTCFDEMFHVVKKRGRDTLQEWTNCNTITFHSSMNR